MVQGSINEKIKDCRSNMHESHNPIYNDSLEVEIEALEWVQGQIQHYLKQRHQNTNSPLNIHNDNAYLHKAISDKGTM
jgi:hypothetical protein